MLVTIGTERVKCAGIPYLWYQRLFKRRFRCLRSDAKICQPVADTEVSRRTRDQKPLVPRVVYLNVLRILVT